MKDLHTGSLIRGSTGSNGEESNGVNGAGQLSADGRYLVFNSAGSNFAAGDVNNNNDVFRKDLLTGEIRLVSVTRDGTMGDASSTGATVSSDGRYIAFTSTSTTFGVGGVGVRKVFFKDMETGQLSVVSSASDGTAGDFGASGTASISQDGRFVVFQSPATNLVSGDTNGISDTFVKDTLTGTTTRVSLKSDGTQITNGTGSRPLNGNAISADGRYIIFANNATDVVQGQTTTAMNLYLSRRDGQASASTNAIGDSHGMYITSQIAARFSLDNVNRYREELSIVRGDIGSALSRFQVAGRTLAVRTENYQAAKCRIIDADIASESSKLISQGILQQAASSVLAQANQQPALALRLLAN